MVGVALDVGRSLLGGLTGCVGGRLARLQQDLQEWLGGVAPPRRSPPVDSQATVEAAKFTVDPALAPASRHATECVAPADLVERLVAVARDPWSLFVYWEIPAARRIERLRSLGPAAEGAVESVRIRERPDGRWQAFELPPGTNRRYIQVDRPGTSWDVELGLRTRAGAFVRWLGAEAPATTPPAAASADTAVHWMAVRPGGVVVPADRAWNGVVVQPEAPASAATSPALPSSHLLPRS